MMPYLQKDWNQNIVYDADEEYLEEYYKNVLGWGWFSCPKAADPADYTDYWGKPRYPFMPPQGFYGMMYPTVMAYDKSYGQTGSAVLDTLPGEVGMVADTCEWFIWSPSVWTLTVDADGDGIIDTSQSLWVGGFQPWNKYNLFRPRHLNGGNVFFADWHVEPVTIKEWVTNEALWGPWPR